MTKKIMKRSMCLMVALSCIVLGACVSDGNTLDNTENESPIVESESLTTENEASPEDIAKRDEERFLELFAECYKKYEEEGLGVEFRYDELASIYHKYPDNEMMENLFLFCSTCANYSIYCIA